MTYLVVTISNDGPLNDHTQATATAAHNKLFSIQRNLYRCTRGLKDFSYKTFVRTKLEYTHGLWGPHTDKNISKLESVQKRAAKFVFSDYRRRKSISQLLGCLNWESLRARRKFAKLMMDVCTVKILVAIRLSQLQLFRSMHLTSTGDPTIDRILSRGNRQQNAQHNHVMHPSPSAVKQTLHLMFFGVYICIGIEETLFVEEKYLLQSWCSMLWCFILKYIKLSSWYGDLIVSDCCLIYDRVLQIKFIWVKIIVVINIY